MKRYIKTVWVLVITLLFAIPNNEVKAQPGVSVSFQTFYDELSPYGRWIDAPGQGYVWVPNAGDGFRPYYSGGHWVMTEYGNTWVSDYDWGWAPFHYGRWTYDPYYGWMWIPDTVWGPAWVTWRNGGGYYGWAPMAPGISINVAIGPSYNVANDWWVFIPHKYIYSPRFHSYYRGPRYNTTIINRTTIINNTYVYNNHRYITGPRRDDIERRTGQRVVTYNVRDNNRPGRSNINDHTVNIYRPRVEQRKENIRPQNAVNAERPIQGLSRTPANNREQRNPVDRPVQNDRERQPAREIETQQRNQANNRDVRMQQQNERNEQERQQRETRQRDIQENNRQADVQRQREMQDRNRATEQRQREIQNNNRAAEQRQNTDIQRQREVQQRAEQQQRIEQNRQQHWERRQETEQRPQQRMERQAPQRNMQPQQRQEQREAPSRERRGR